MLIVLCAAVIWYWMQRKQGIPQPCESKSNAQQIQTSTNEHAINASVKQEVDLGAEHAITNIQPQDTGSICGRVTAENGEPMRGVSVVAISLSDLMPLNRPEYSANDETDTNGFYALLGLQEGEYAVVFDTFENSKYVPQIQIYRDISVSIESKLWVSLLTYGASLCDFLPDNEAIKEKSTPIHIAAGKKVDGIDALMCATLDPKFPFGSISGRVTDSEGRPIKGIFICSIEAIQGERICEISDTNGFYCFDRVATGQYTILFSQKVPPNARDKYVKQYYHNKLWQSEADTVTVSSGEAITGIDAKMRFGGMLSGRITDCNQKPLENIRVHALIWNEKLNDIDALHGQGTESDINGEYTISGLMDGMYFVSFLENSYPFPKYEKLWFNNVLSKDDASAVEIRDCNHVHNINACFCEKMNVISGTVYWPTNWHGSMNYCDIQAWRPNDTKAGYGRIKEAILGKSEYCIWGLKAGEYRIALNLGGSYVVEENADLEYYSPLVLTSTSAYHLVELVDDQSVTGLDFKLNEMKGKGGQIEGTITAENEVMGNRIKVPAENCGVNIQLVEQRFPSTHTSFCSDSNGSYIIKGLPAGTYLMTVHAPGGFHYAEIRDYEITLKEGETLNNIDFILQPESTVSGRIIPLDSQSKEFLWLRYIYPKMEFLHTKKENSDFYIADEFGLYQNPPFNGFYKFQGLGPGKYRLCSNIPETDELNYYTFMWQVAGGYVFEAPEIEVKAGENAIYPDTILMFKLGMSGNVCDAETLQPLDDIQVEIYIVDEETGIRSVTVASSQAGKYAVNLMEKGYYAVRFVDPQNIYAEQWFNGVANWQQAGVFPVDWLAEEINAYMHPISR